MTDIAERLRQAQEWVAEAAGRLLDRIDLGPQGEAAAELWRTAVQPALDQLRAAVGEAGSGALAALAAIGLLWLARGLLRRRRARAAQQRGAAPGTALVASPAGGTALAVPGGRRPASREADRAALRGQIGRPVRLGFAVILLFVLGFGVWGSVAPLAGGAVAPGVISPDGSRRTVQHLEGGIIGKLLVRDGDLVEEGQPLLILENIQPRATYEILLGQHRTLLATRARLHAEQLGRDQLTFPPELLAGDPGEELRAILEGQRQMFEARREIHAARKRVLQQRIEQLNEQIRGLEAQVESASRQLALITDELSGKQELWRRELITKPEVLRLERARAELFGNRGEHVAAIAQARQQIGETELQLLALDAERADQITTQLDQVRADIASVEERLAASRDILNRTVVAAPVSGAIVNLHFKTEGGVVRPGEPILDIVPAEENLLIDARISPVDIDVVHGGLPAKVHLSAYSNRSVPRVPGVVKTVSADRLVDEHTGQPYYLARVEVDRDDLRRIGGPQVELVPGMPAEVLIVTAERTMLGYLFQPFLDALWRSFREV